MLANDSVLIKPVLRGAGGRSKNVNPRGIVEDDTLLTLVVLAAGMGSRYGGLKQVDPVGPNGEILLEYSVFDALRAGFERVIFVIRPDLEQAFDEHIGSRLRTRVPLQYAYQKLEDLPPGSSIQGPRSKPWGTGQAIWACRELVKGPFVAINADDFYGLQSYQLVADQLRLPEATYSMAGFYLRNTLSDFGAVSRGICQSQGDHWLDSVIEHTKIVKEGDHIVSQAAVGGPQNLTGDELVSMNFWGLQPSIFPELARQFSEFLAASPGEKGEFYIPGVLDTVVQQKRGRVKILVSSESWFGVTYPEDKPLVVDQISRRVSHGEYPEKLWS